MIHKIHKNKLLAEATITANKYNKPFIVSLLNALRKKFNFSVPYVRLNKSDHYIHIVHIKNNTTFIKSQFTDSRFIPEFIENEFKIRYKKSIKIEQNKQHANILYGLMIPDT